MEENYQQREARRLARCRLLNNDDAVVRGFAAELADMMKRADITETELVSAVSAIIDNPPKDKNGGIQWISTGHIKIWVDQHRTEAMRRLQLEKYERQKAEWRSYGKDEPGYRVWCMCRDYLYMREPTEADRERVVDAIREEAKRHPPGSELRKNWITAGTVWSQMEGSNGNGGKKQAKGVEGGTGNGPQDKPDRGSEEDPPVRSHRGVEGGHLDDGGGQEIHSGSEGEEEPAQTDTGVAGGTRLPLHTP